MPVPRPLHRMGKGAARAQATHALAFGMLWCASSALAQPSGESTSPREPVEAVTRSAADTIAADIPQIFYKGWRGAQLIGQSVKTFQDDGLGNVEDILLAADGQVTALVVKGGGFIGIGDSVFPIPWPLVKLTPGESGVIVPITKQEAKRQGLFAGPEKIELEPGTYRLSELVGREAVLEDGAPAEIEDVLFNSEGKAIAVMVSLPGEESDLYARSVDALAAYSDHDSGRPMIVLPPNSASLLQ